jgi:tetratricopeptide (TPR) repeat protein
VRLSSIFPFVLFLSFSLVLTAATPQLHNTAGLAFYYQGKYAQAFEEFLQALKKDPNNVAAHFNIARVFERQGKLQDAFVQYQRALSLDPTHQGAKLGYERLIRFRQAPELKVKSEEEVLEETIRKDDIRAEGAREDLLGRHLRQIAALFEERRYPEGYELITKSRELFPDSGELYFFEGRYFFVESNYLQSIRSLEKAISLGVAEEDLANYLLALNYERLGDFPRSEKHLVNALEIAPSNSVYYERLGAVLQRMGKNISAYEKYREGVRVNPSAVETRVKLNELGGRLSRSHFNEGRIAFEKREYLLAYDSLSKAIEFGQLTPEQEAEAKNLLGISEYWVKRSQKVNEIKELQQEKTLEVHIKRDISFLDAADGGGVYLNEYISWQGQVLAVEQKGEYYEIIVDTDPENDHQRDMEMSSFCIVRVRGKIPSDRRLSYLSSAEFEGKFIDRQYIRNPFNSQTSSRKQPVVTLTDGRFRHDNFGSGFLRVFPHFDYKD